MRVWLKELREAKGLTQQNMADRMGITVQNYGQIENGERQKHLRANTIETIAKALNMGVTTILRYELQQGKQYVHDNETVR